MFRHSYLEESTSFFKKPKSLTEVELQEKSGEESKKEFKDQYKKLVDNLNASSLNTAIRRARNMYVWGMKEEKNIMALVVISGMTGGIYGRRKFYKIDKIQERVPLKKEITDQNAAGYLRTILEGEGANDNRDCFKYYLVSQLLNRKAASDIEAKHMVSNVFKVLQQRRVNAIKLSQKKQKHDDSDSEFEDDSVEPVDAGVNPKKLQKN